MANAPGTSPFKSRDLRVNNSSISKSPYVQIVLIVRNLVLRDRYIPMKQCPSSSDR